MHNTLPLVKKSDILAHFSVFLSKIDSITKCGLFEFNVYYVVICRCIVGIHDRAYWCSQLFKNVQNPGSFYRYFSRFSLDIWHIPNSHSQWCSVMRWEHHGPSSKRHQVPTSCNRSSLCLYITHFITVFKEFDQVPTDWFRKKQGKHHTRRWIHGLYQELGLLICTTWSVVNFTWDWGQFRQWDVVTVWFVYTINCVIVI